MERRELEDLVAALALDAVDGTEADAAAAALAADADLRSQFDDHCETIAAVAGAAAEAPPARVWARIAAGIDDEPVPAPVIPLDRRRRTTVRIVSALSVAAVALSAVLAWRVVDQDRRIDELTTALATDRLAAAAEDAAAAPGAVRVSLTGAATVDVVVTPDGLGYVVADDLPTLAADRTYQLWAIVGDAVISAGVLGPDPDLVPFQVVGDLAGLAITEEVAGGVVSSANAPVAVWLADA